MNPVLKRILLHGGLTAGLLALVGLLFAEMAGMWMGTGAGPPAPTDLNPPVGPARMSSARSRTSAFSLSQSPIRYRVPLMMAFWGFAFVAVCELVLSRFRKRAAVKPAEPPPDDAETLLNELLAQAEAKTAAEGQGLKTEKNEEPQMYAENADEERKPKSN